MMMVQMTSPCPPDKPLQLFRQELHQDTFVSLLKILLIVDICLLSSTRMQRSSEHGIPSCCRDVMWWWMLEESMTLRSIAMTIIRGTAKSFCISSHSCLLWVLPPLNVSKLKDRKQPWLPDPTPLGGGNWEILWLETFLLLILWLQVIWRIHAQPQSWETLADQVEQRRAGVFPLRHPNSSHTFGPQPGGSCCARALWQGTSLYARFPPKRMHNQGRINPCLDPSRNSSE